MAIPLAVIGAMAAAGALGAGASHMSGAGQANDNISDANSQLDTVKGQLQGQGDNINAMATEAYNPLIQNFESDMAAYRDLVSQDGKIFEYNQYDPFNYNMDDGIQKFMDPMIEAKIKSATDNIQASAANTGALFSSATGHGMATEAATLKGDSWKDALQAAMQDRSFKSGRYDSDRDRDDRGVEFQAGQHGQNLSRKMDGLSHLTGMGADGTMNLANEKIKTQRDVFSGMNDIDLQRISNNMNRQDESFLGTAGSMLTGGAGAAGGPLGAFLKGK